MPRLLFVSGQQVGVRMPRSSDVVFVEGIIWTLECSRAWFTGPLSLTRSHTPGMTAEAKSLCFIVLPCSNIANNSYFIMVLWLGGARNSCFIVFL